MVILCSRDPETMTMVDAALLSGGIDNIVWHPASVQGVYELHVAESDAPAATAILYGLWRDQFEPAAPVALQAAGHNPAQAPLWQQPPFAWALGMASLLLAFFAVTGGRESGTFWYAKGVFIHAPQHALAPWRCLTAATLHANMSHACGNAAMALVMFWGAGERLGEGVATALWLFTAVAGFAASWCFGPAPAWVVGASGGLFGLWGAICGHAWRYPHASAYKPRIRTVGVVTMLMGMLAFAHDADIAAHLGGCAAGVGAGLVCPRAPPGRLWQIAAALIAAGLVGWSWKLALAAG